MTNYLRLKYVRGALVWGVIAVPSILMGLMYWAMFCNYLKGAING
jgi:hypothetical protein